MSCYAVLCCAFKELPEVSFQHVGSGQFCEDGGDLLEGALGLKHVEVKDENEEF